MSYYRYWGKANQGEYHLLAYHSLDVAAVAWHLLDKNKTLLLDLTGLLQVVPEQLKRCIVFAVVLHDLGKFTAAFQQLNVFPDAPLCRLPCRRPYDAKNLRHDGMGWLLWTDLIKDDRLKAEDVDLPGSAFATNSTKKSFDLLLQTSFGHHGKPINPAPLESIRNYCHEQNFQDAADFIRSAFQLLQPVWPERMLCPEQHASEWQQASWYLAGIITLSDWIGSNRDWFPYCQQEMPLVEYWQQAKDKAIQAIAASELHQAIQVQPFLSVKDHFGFDDPTPLQQWAEMVVLDHGPQLFILEDVTGAGKTEAALTLTHRLLAAGEADGFYFGLPTMATSNAMFDRVADHYQKMLTAGSADEMPSLVLAHGARDMHKRFREALSQPMQEDVSYVQGDETASIHCSQWLADSRKKALLASVGVGTIDQALMAVLPMKHQSLRLLGLHRKVLIFDEVHAADSYMFELLDDLLQAHLRQGGSAILLTATLATRQRARLCRIWQEAAGLPLEPLQEQHFPLATHLGLASGLHEERLSSRASVSRSVAVDFVSSEDEVLARILAAHQVGDCVVWVRNSVKDALQAYEQLVSRLQNQDDLLLFHSRFTLMDRKNVENRVLASFGKHSSLQERRGKILIATQVFQESLDADADLMISDLCPIDDLIQRAGRLHRHLRDDQRRMKTQGRDARSEPVLLVHAPEWQDQPGEDWLSKPMRDTELVYRSPGRLWLSMKILRKLKALRMPEEARKLIEAVYGDDADAGIPEALRVKEDAAWGEKRSQVARAITRKIAWNKGYTLRSSRAWTDDMEISTRYSEQETVQVLVLKKDSEDQLLLWAEGQPHAVQQSLVKLPKNTYAAKLAALSATDQLAYEQMQVRWPMLRYLQPWLPERDERFSYSPLAGVVEREAPLTRGRG
ncbi:CRISPR-associated helicase/endonuclease Cas3 [Marinospirillum alkaliphilum]|uniref:CRISPR-associated endonuclease/helicase Cas3 n=1 Tax=Marinospirillum alkaliphilum DSM 21637 TaxID=1122209 RepID=A0A1K1WAZ3_9GAMM|nr:CRISPR-associated helicase/endonuclease Cas3 [Marinospirillum alkaliphilum]SFX34156.1 CRISPR-associated endonuclease/helicase Cas3 [Marinospirillum alkaliphilum DSM 21637]